MQQQSLAIVAVAVGGAIGSVSRYLVSSWFVERVGSGFPWGTMFINVSGSLAIGVVLQLALSRAGLSPYVRLFFATGILGGFTTFSAYAFEIYAMASAERQAQSLAYALGSVAAGVTAAYVGAFAVRVFAR
jgi:CrcB protein